MDNGNASVKQPISNNYKGGEMADDEKNTKGNKEKQVSVSPAWSKSEEDQPGSPSHSPRSSMSDNGHSSSSSSFVSVPTSGEGGTDNGKHSQTPDSNNDTSSFEKIDEEPSVTPANSKDEDDQRSSQPSLPLFNLSLLPASDDEYDGLSEASDVPEDDVTDEEDIDDYDLSWLFSEEDDNNRQEDPHSAPTPTPEPTPAPIPTPEPIPVPPSLNKREDDAQNNGKQPTDPKKNDATPQNIKSSNLRIIAASALAIVGVVLGVAIAVHLEMLVVGILVGACCLVADAVIYCCGPQSSIENSEVEKVAPKEKKFVAASV